MNRLDKEMVERKIVPTRTKAQELIDAQCVAVNGKIQTKSSLNVKRDDVIELKDNNILKYVSRGGLKLEKASTCFNVDVGEKICVDIGSSTGGFTDCCLQHGAKKVIAIDVGTNVMHESLRTDSRVELHENTNVVDVPNEKFQQADLVVVDVSFVSLERIVEKVASTGVFIDMICLIKPQFECGKQIAKKYNGIIKSKTVHKDVLNKVVAFFNKNGFYLKKLDISPIKGGDGNSEYISLFTNKVNSNIKVKFDNFVNEAFNKKYE